VSVNLQGGQKAAQSADGRGLTTADPA
jgi:hypothetical protein